MTRSTRTFLGVFGRVCKESSALSRENFGGWILVLSGKSPANGAGADAVILGDALEGPTVTTLAGDALCLAFGQPQDEQKRQGDEDGNPSHEASNRGHESKAV